MPIISAGFRPPWWLRNPHLQTCWPTLLRRRASLRVYPQRVELPDGDFLDLAWTVPPGAAVTGPLVVVLHGLEGSLQSPYVWGALAAIEAQGWAGVLLHFRGCSGVPNRLPRSYHAGDTGDLRWLVDRLRRRHPASPLAALGYSVGANVLLKYLGEERAATPLRAAAAVCPPLRLAACANRLERGASRGYQRYLLNKLKAGVRRKQQTLDLAGCLRLPPGGLAAVTTLRAYDDAVTAPVHGFAGVDEYYERCSAMPFLATIAVPTLILHAADDPFMTPAVVPGPGALPPGVRYELSRHGGHVGFIEHRAGGRIGYWIERRVPEYLSLLLT